MFLPVQRSVERSPLAQAWPRRSLAIAFVSAVLPLVLCMALTGCGIGTLDHTSTPTPFAGPALQGPCAWRGSFLSPGSTITLWSSGIGGQPK